MSISSACRLLGLLLLPSCAWAADRVFDPQQAFEHVRVLSEEIGPRPTTDPREAEARAYVKARLRAFGLDPREVPVGWVRMTRRPGKVWVGSRQLITVVPGRDPNRAERLLLAAHLDTRDPSCPGANDDASAVGVALETARTLALSPLDLDVVILITTAEELGLLGAHHYVQTEGVEDLRFVLTLDPVGYGDLFVAPFPGAPQLWANRRLIEAARRGGVHRVAVDPAYLLIPRVLDIPFGADHIPFLEAGVPAFNLSNRLERWSYHTERDTLDRIDPATLGAAGELTLTLLEDAASAPVSMYDDPRYLVVPLWGGRRLFLPGLLLLLLVPVGAAAGILSLFVLRERPWSDLLLAGLGWALLVELMMIPEKILEWIHGLHYPWWSSPGRYLLLSFLFGLLALIPLRIGWRRLGLSSPSRRPTAWIAAGAAASGILAAGLWAAVGRDAAFYFAWPALVFAMYSFLQPRLDLPRSPGAVAHLLVTFLAAYPLLALARPELYRQALELLAYGWSPIPGLFGLLLVIAGAPFAWVLAACPGLGDLRAGGRSAAILAAGAAYLLVALAFVDPHPEAWPQTVLATYRFSAPGEKAELRVQSYDRIGSLSLGEDHHEISGTEAQLEGMEQTPLRETLRWEPSVAGEGTLSVDLRTTSPARRLGIRLHGEGLVLPEEDLRGGRIDLQAAGQKSRWRWSGVVRAEPGSPLKVVPFAQWDSAFDDGSPARTDHVVDAGGYTMSGYAERTFEIPE